MCVVIGLVCVWMKVTIRHVKLSLVTVGVGLIWMRWWTQQNNRCCGLHQAPVVLVKLVNVYWFGLGIRAGCCT